MTRWRWVLGAVVMFVQAAPVQDECKDEIVAILDGVRTHGPSQETTLRVLVSTEDTSKPPRIVSRWGNVVRTMPPGLLQVAVL